ncbi:serine/threonine protein kinase [Erythrobacter sp. HI0063]|jgi:NAD(P)-dependent dehydrogenase (short-subunit alcohol dehydrogenase family)|uniref:SDR family NAD(P)-dependent oxidoreductase n=1 Tax=Erythrobacter sp. HI0063 TaxID=1822240 RepID=UPI0007C3D2C0|nr:SDR family NAD(P)-dependent oxidoreductase [Erythrobacter sp. HI0063]KZY57216.1 serine/threonine protein kinase [Erythrobacter sp. HI0063]
MGIDLTGRVALVTGAGGGLGREHALLLARSGAHVVVNDLGGAMDGEGGGSSAADQVVEEIRAAGGVAIADRNSVSDPSGAKAMIDVAIKQFGKLDILVNNAGILRDKSFAKMTADDFAKVVDVHLIGAFQVTHAAWAHMLERQYGRIVFTTSAAGTNGNFGQANYGAAKMGLVGLMNCLAIEGARKGITVNCIAPGARTRMTETMELGALADLMNPALVSPALAYLCSEGCAETGLIVSAVAGHYSALKMFETHGVQFDPASDVAPEDIAAKWSAITDLSTAQPVKPGPMGDLLRHLKEAGHL